MTYSITSGSEDDGTLTSWAHGLDGREAREYAMYLSSQTGGQYGVWFDIRRDTDNYRMAYSHHGVFVSFGMGEDFE